MISGATGDNQNEFDTITNIDQLSISSATASLISCKKPSTRTRKKHQLKLRFHHQALPQEYLDHYEATQNSLLGKDSVFEQSLKQKDNNSLIQTDMIDQLQDQKLTESVQNWLQKVSEFHDEKTVPPIINIPEASTDQKSSHSTGKKPTRVVTYKDLPYMGEMTLENSKPRRGRKPKKADICHLIYKNYGTIFPNKTNMDSEKTDSSEKQVEPTSKSNSNKIISSLLEKRLTQEKLKNLSSTQNKCPESLEGKRSQSEQPLNLCIRDNNYECDILTVSSSSVDENNDNEDDDNDNEEDDDTESVLDFKKEIASLDVSSNLAANALLASKLKMALPNFRSALLDKSLLSAEKSVDNVGSPSSNNCMDWPKSNVFINPMALYLQNIADASSCLKKATSITPSDPTSSTSTAETSEAPTRKLVPKKLSQLVKGENICQSGSTSNPKSKQSSDVTSTSTTASNSKTSTTTPAKRKRSAIFIPPMPEESSTNHATEVSICKFKFTGGAKPSLQEKKMLSVDAGGNFRYYSGTGDKSIRGYEFFPRESLKQSSLMAGSSAGAFLNATGQKMSTDLSPPSQGLSNELLQIPDLINPNISSVLASAPQRLRHQHHRNERRKRKSKRSLQRESLEKTFKEKGFLIQTQQLESAEGATYCKFRQLRKFTRYLFRSWKDYLPGELQQNQQPIPMTPDAFSCIENLDSEATTSTCLPIANTDND